MNTKNNKNSNETEVEIEIISESVDTEHDLKVLNECWHISIHPRAERINTNSSRMQIEKLSTIGKIKRFETINDVNKSGADISRDGFEIDFKSDKSKNEIESVLNSLRDDYKIRILPPNSSISDYIELVEDLSGKNMRIGEILKEIGSLTEFELNEVLSIQKELLSESNVNKERKHIGELLVKEKMVQESVLLAALKKQEKVKNAGSS